MTDKSAVELGAIGQVSPCATRLLCDFHRSQAWERWVSKNANDINPQDRSDVLEQLKKLAYAPTSMLFCKDFISRVSYRGRGALVFLPSSLSPPRNSELYYCICECELSIKVGRGDIFRVS